MTPTDAAALRLQIVNHEGRVMANGQHAIYDDVTGKALYKGDTIRGNLTGGFGHNFSANGFGELRALDFLDDDITVATGILSRRYDWFLGLDTPRQRVLIEAMFNLGPAPFAQFTQMIAALAAKQYPEAAKQLLQSDAARKAALRYGELSRWLEMGQID